MPKDLKFGEWCYGHNYYDGRDGKSAQENIQTKLFDVAKKRIFDRSKLGNQAAYELGFKYPHHFTRLLMQRMGR
jgi:hypothetical protein